MQYKCQKHNVNLIEHTTESYLDDGTAKIIGYHFFCPMANCEFQIDEKVRR